LDFEHPLTRISVSGAFLPSSITGDVRAQAIADGLAVTASTSLGAMAGLGLSVVGITVFFQIVGHGMSTFYLIWPSLPVLATALHAWQAARALRRMTTAATTL